MICLKTRVTKSPDGRIILAPTHTKPKKGMLAQVQKGLANVYALILDTFSSEKINV
jgi:hypothetical protein